jgi:hypothetical protein
MSKGLLIGLGIAALVIFWGIGVRNGLATGDQGVQASWANVETAYQRRADLIPNLVKTVQGVANFEKGTLTDVIAARASATQIKFKRPFSRKYPKISSGTKSIIRFIVSFDGSSRKLPTIESNREFLGIAITIRRY